MKYNDPIRKKKNEYIDVNWYLLGIIAAICLLSLLFIVMVGIL